MNNKKLKIHDIIKIELKIIKIIIFNHILYYLAKTLRPQNVQEIIDDLFNMEEVLTKDDMLMIITKDEMNETTMNLLKHIWEQDGILIVNLSLKRLQFNILEHQLVAPHRILSKDEVAEVFIVGDSTVDADTVLLEARVIDSVAEAVLVLVEVVVLV
jgi:hypothetical protein